MRKIGDFFFGFEFGLVGFGLLGVFLEMGFKGELESLHLEILLGLLWSFISIVIVDLDLDLDLVGFGDV